MTWQASWPPTRSRHDDRQPPDSNSSGVLGPARRGRGTVGDDLCVRPNHAALDPHERPVHWPSPRARSWCSDGSPAKAASRSPARSSRSATATPARPSPCSSLAQSDQRIDRPLLPDRPPSGRLVSGTGGQAGVGGHASVWTISGLDGVSGRPSHAGHQRGRVLLAAAAADMATLRSAKTNQSGTAATAGPGRLSEHGQRRPAWSPVARARTGRLCRRPCRTLALWPSGMASRFRTPRPDGRVQWSSSGTGG
jgi:hypothetical protein